MKRPKSATVDPPDEDWQALPDPPEPLSWEECRKLADKILDKRTKKRKPLR